VAAVAADRQVDAVIGAPKLKRDQRASQQRRFVLILFFTLSKFPELASVAQPGAWE